MKNTTHTFAILAYQESPYLEDCIKSCLNQQSKSQVIIATSTPNSYIDKFAKKYNLPVYVRPEKDRGKGAASDFDFALQSGISAGAKLITIANHDEVYDYNYASEVIEYFSKHQNCVLIFTKYYDIKGNFAVYKQLNFFIKDLLCWPLVFSKKATWAKRTLLAFGDPICCPAVTFVADHTKLPIFEGGGKSTFDYFAWEKLSKNKYAFGYIPKSLMGHRIHAESITSAEIRNNARSREEYEILCKFWPKPIAKLISSLYKLSERSNV